MTLLSYKEWLGTLVLIIQRFIDGPAKVSVQVLFHSPDDVLSHGLAINDNNSGNSQSANSNEIGRDSQDRKWSQTIPRGQFISWYYRGVYRFMALCYGKVILLGIEVLQVK